MNKPSRYKIHVDSMLRLTEFFGEYSQNDDLWVEIPNLDGLDEAVCLVNKACSIELQRRQKNEFDEFVANQFAKLKQFIDSGEKNSVKARALMEETASFHKRKK